MSPKKSDTLYLVYTTHASVAAAEKLGAELMKRRLAACLNIFPEMQPMFFWPPKSNKIDKSSEVVMLIKTLESKFDQLEHAICELHPDTVPCIIAWPAPKVGAAYYKWLVGELESLEE